MYFVDSDKEVIEIAKETQGGVENYLEDTISLAMDIIPSDEPLSLIAKFVTRRNQPELDLFTQEGDREPVPLLNTVDLNARSVEEIIAFASQFCIWSINDPQPSPFQVFDEPFGSLKKDNIGTAIQVIQELQSDLNMQIIIATHEPEIAGCGHKVLEFTKSKGTSKVREL